MLLSNTCMPGMLIIVSILESEGWKCKLKELKWNGFSCLPSNLLEVNKEQDFSSSPKICLYVAFIT